MPETQTVASSDIKAFIVDTFLFGDCSGVADDTSFMAAGLVDSMGILKIADFIERTYGITLEPDHYVPENLDCIDHIVNYIKRSKSPEVAS